MLNISFLGEQVIADSTGTVRTRSSRSIELVAFLIVHAGSPQSRQRIAAMFWPDSTDAQAFTNLRRELHHLRNMLSDDVSLSVTAKDLCWSDTETCRVDVRVFHRERQAALAASRNGDDDGVLLHAAAAIEQYRGEFLPAGADDWLLETRDELEGQCVELLDLSCRTMTRTGDLTAAVAVARRRIHLRPLEEIGYRILMELQGDLGDRAGAVSTYHHCASVLERELGVEPDPATRSLLNRLLARVERAAVSKTVEPVAGRSGVAAAELVGRDAELAELQDIWRGAAGGRPGLTLVRGGAGVGKTRLVSELAESARRSGAVVASTQCFGTSRRLALSPLADWLRAPAVQAGLGTLDPVWRVEVERLVPSGKTRGDPAAGPRAMVDAWQRHRFFEGLSRALTGVGRPMLLVLDNLQWCDQETLTFLTFCLGLIPDAPILVAATLRDDDYEPELVDWTARMRATGMVREVDLGPLQVTDTARLAEAISGRTLTRDDADLLQATTGGFPFYVVEAARTTVDLASAALAKGDLMGVLRNRFAQVGPSVREVAGLAAAVGRNFTLDLLTEASDLDADSVVRAVDELWRRRIVRELRDGYDFSHDLLREAAYAQVSPPKRWLSHRRLAQGLELLHADDMDAVSAQLAEQYARGGRPARAIGYFRVAADVAAARFAHAEAIRLHREVLSIVLTLPDGKDRDRQELQTLEAMAAPLNANYGYSSRNLQVTLERCIVLAKALGRKDSELAALIGLWTTQFVQGELDAGQDTVTRAMTLVEPDSELSGSAHFVFGGNALSRGMPEVALRHFERAAEVTRGVASLIVGTRPDVHGQAFAAHAQWLLGHDREALASCDGAIALARTIENPYSLAVALAYGSVTHQLRGDVSELTRTVQELGELCERYGFAYYREWALILSGWQRGGEAGIALARQGLENLKSAGSYARMPYWLSLLADLSARADRFDAARALLDAAVAGGNARHDLWWMPEVMRMRAAYDEPQAAQARLRSAARLASAHGSLALLRRCTDDLAARGVPAAALGVRSAALGVPAAALGVRVDSEATADNRNAVRTPRS